MRYHNNDNFPRLKLRRKFKILIKMFDNPGIVRIYINDL
jgi:hypothetical protein